MNESIGIRIFGWMFLIFGSLIIILGAVVSSQRNTDFINDEKIFRVIIIGLIMFCSGSISLFIYRIDSQLQKFGDGIRN